MEARASLSSPASLVSLSVSQVATFGTIGIPPAGRTCIYSFAGSLPGTVLGGFSVVSDDGQSPISVACTASGTRLFPAFSFNCPTFGSAGVEMTLTYVYADSGRSGVEVGRMDQPTFDRSPRSLTVNCGDSISTSRPPLAVRLTSAAQPADDIVVGMLTLRASF